MGWWLLRVARPTAALQQPHPQPMPTSSSSSTHVVWMMSFARYTIASRFCWSALLQCWQVGGQAGRREELNAGIKAPSQPLPARPPAACFAGGHLCRPRNQSAQINYLKASSQTATSLRASLRK